MRCFPAADTTMLNAVTSFLFVAALAALAVWARRHEPHWVDKDGSRFLAKVRVVDPRGGRPGRWQQVRGGIGGPRIIIRAGFTASRTVDGTYAVESKLADDHGNHAIYSLRGPVMLALRVPRRSPLVPVLDAMCTARPG